MINTVCIEFIIVSSMLYRCRIVVSLMKMPVFFDATWMNHQCNQCSLDCGRDSITTTSELLTFVDSLTFWPLSYNLLSYESAWVAINWICIISTITNGQFLGLSVTCKINWAALKKLQNFILFRLPHFWKQPSNPV